MGNPFPTWYQTAKQGNTYYNEKLIRSLLISWTRVISFHMMTYSIKLLQEIKKKTKFVIIFSAMSEHSLIHKKATLFCTFIQPFFQIKLCIVGDFWRFIKSIVMSVEKRKARNVKKNCTTPMGRIKHTDIPCPLG